MIKYNYYGHSCFLLETDTYKILSDPFLTGNPLAAIAADIVEADYILVSHAHADHLGDAPEIAKRTGAILISTPEVLELCTGRTPGINTHPMNIGGSYKTEFGKLRMTYAIHSAGVSGGIACGYVIEIDDMHIYFAGDTSLFQGMQVIGQKESIDYALLPIGDNYTMGLEDAALAAQWLNTKNVIPIHYNTWPIIEQDVEKYKEVTEHLTRATVHIVKPGESLRLL